MNPLETTQQWRDVVALKPPASLGELFATSPERVQSMTLRVGGLLIDYSKQLLDPKIIEALLSVSLERDVASAFQDMADGQAINVTERRAVGHMALRSPKGQRSLMNGIDVAPEVHATLDRMATLATAVRSGDYVGATGSRIRTIVNIGIGGSDLGPSMMYEALRSLRSAEISCRFVANVDPADLAANLQGLEPAETLFIVTSKTFTTQETLSNATAAREWLVAALGQTAVDKHFVAVSSDARAVKEFGIDPRNMFAIWDWVGGRFSLPSAVGLAVMIAIGPEAFQEFLIGMHSMDTHTRDSVGADNAPLMLALINIWNSSVLQSRSRVVMPYSFDLRRFPAYLQQLVMESNGKTVRKDGSLVPYATSPVVWGESGTNAQHAFMQLLHQGTDVVPVDFIGFARSDSSDKNRQGLLFANMLAQSQALAFGQPQDAQQERHRNFSGNRPSTTIVAAELTPRVLGELIALYEHVVFFEGAMWGINSFDQWGVELGKELATQISQNIADVDDTTRHNMDASTHTLLQWFSEQQTNTSQSPLH